MIWLGIEFVVGCIIALILFSVIVGGSVGFITACRLAWKERKH